MSIDIKLPSDDGTLSRYVLRGEPLPVVPADIPFCRIAYSAAHVVADPLRSGELNAPPVIDWERTIEYRRYLIGQGLGIAEAMDTAQRGMGLPWPTALELIERTVRETADLPGARIASGCGTDQYAGDELKDIAGVISAYKAQLDAIQSARSRVILMASRALARVATSPEDYVRVYREVLTHAEAPVILHWLGEMFDPALQGYWGATGYSDAAETCLQIIHENCRKIDGIKISLLDKEKEEDFRRRLPASVKMYTGDDFNYPELIAGDGQQYSHALLGIFDAIAPAASQALTALTRGDRAAYDRLLQPTVPLSRLIFRTPTQYYKTGVVFLAYLNGFQEHFFMLGGHHGMRPPAYFAEIFKLADQAGLLQDPGRATQRCKALLAVLGCPQS